MHLDVLRGDVATWKAVGEGIHDQNVKTKHTQKMMVKLRKKILYSQYLLAHWQMVFSHNNEISKH